MDKDKSKYTILKTAYDFLNRQIALFEKTVEMQLTEYQLLKGIGTFTDASKVQLTKYKDGVYSLINE